MKFEELSYQEVLCVIGYVPVPVLTVLTREPVVLAGGLIRDTLANLPIKDIDIFCHSEEQAERLALSLSPFVRHTTFAYTVDVEGIPIQFVFYKEFSDAKDLVGQFDFRACCAGVYWVERWGFQGVAVEGFREDCSTKTLRFMSQAKDAGKLTALGRALALAGRGWKLSTNEAAAIVSHFAPDLEPEKVKFAFRPAYGASR